MKKLLFATALTLMCLTSVGAYASGECESGSGNLYQTQNGKTFCVSPKAMNWWSAAAWCQGVKSGARLATLHEMCSTIEGEGFSAKVTCSNVSNGKFLPDADGNTRSKDVWGWTATYSGSGSAYHVLLNDGRVYSNIRTNTNNAVCVW